MSDSLAVINIIPANSAAKKQLHLSLKGTTLMKLKEELESPNSRIFHLGRELRSGGRSLEKLGVGKFRNFNLHIVYPSKQNEQQKQRQYMLTQGVVQLARPYKQEVTVVDLLGDDDEDEVEVVDPPPSKRPKI
mmetsp:Transcript_27217/g.31059  ORF Transcript_27217/g.31059 Transcript_27217/m.31059 type:complete len:133 (+) Transcript_27217:202-600(+)